MSRLRWIGLLLPITFSVIALANGVNPPRTTGSQIVAATCTDRKSGESTTVQRARIDNGKPSASIEVRLGEAEQQTLQLSDVRRIEIVDTTPDADGFVHAVLEIDKPTYRGNGFVRVRADGKPVRLTGFPNGGTPKIVIALESCRNLAIAAPEPAAAEGTPATSP